MSGPILIKNIVTNPQQPRSVFPDETIRELAESIESNGLLQPILVEELGADQYQLISGERRLRAFLLLGRRTIPATVRGNVNRGNRELLVHALVENVQREDMNPIDIARAYGRMRDEFGMSWADIGRVVGKSPTAIQNSVNLLRLDPEIQSLIQTREFTHMDQVVRMLINIPSREARLELVERFRKGKMTTEALLVAGRQLSEIVKAQVNSTPTKSPAITYARKDKTLIDEDHEPTGWNALQQLGRVPPWQTITNSVTASCTACPLASVASKTSCGQCPLVEFLERIIDV